jgi:hypothetical protein
MFNKENCIISVVGVMIPGCLKTSTNRQDGWPAILKPNLSPNDRGLAKLSRPGQSQRPGSATTCPSYLSRTQSSSSWPLTIPTHMGNQERPSLPQHACSEPTRTEGTAITSVWSDAIPASHHRDKTTRLVMKASMENHRTNMTCQDVRMIPPAIGWDPRWWPWLRGHPSQCGPWPRSSGLRPPTQQVARW